MTTQILKLILNTIGGVIPPNSNFGPTLVAFINLLKQFNENVLSAPENQSKIVGTLIPIRFWYNETNTFYQLLHSVSYAVPNLKKLVSVILDLEVACNKYVLGNDILSRKKFQDLSIRAFSTINEVCQWLEVSNYDPGVTPASIYLLWEKSILEKMENSENICLILWVDDEPNENSYSSYEESAVILSSKTEEFAEKLKKMKFLANSDFSGRFRIAVNVRRPDLILQEINIGEFKDATLEILINSEIIDETVVNLKKMEESRADITLTSGTVGFSNFMKMTTLLWTGPLEPELKTALKKKWRCLFMITNLLLRHSNFFRNGLI